MANRNFNIASLLCTALAVQIATACVESHGKHRALAAADSGSAETSGDGSSSACDRDGAVANIDDSEYDQSCITDADCMPVPKGNVCYSCIRACRAGVVNRDAEQQYRSDIARLAGSESTTICFCPLERVPCCMDGECRNDGECGK